MPIYEYDCRQCGARIEELVLRRDDEPQSCPHCAGPLQRRISAHAVGGAAEGDACAGGACPPTPACGAGGCPACV